MIIVVVRKVFLNLVYRNTKYKNTRDYRVAPIMQ